MASKPLSDRNVAAVTTADRTERWVRKGEAGAPPPPPPPADDARKQLTVRTGRPTYGKRGRDAGPPRQQHRPRPASPGRTKKSRPAPPPNKPPAPPREPTAQRPRHKGALPKLAKGLDRRVGGVAPNGNPQCWYAPYETEEDPHRVAQRLKQVEYGKNSDGYKAYIAAVPKCVPGACIAVCLGFGALTLLRGGARQRFAPAHMRTSTQAHKRTCATIRACVLVGISLKVSVTAEAVQEVAEEQPAGDAGRAPEVQQALLRRPPPLLAPPPAHLRPAAGGERERRGRRARRRAGRGARGTRR